MTPKQEALIGLRMMRFEALQCTLGKRPALPNTPLLSYTKTVEESKDKLKELFRMYGDVTEELLDACLPEVTTDRLKKLYMRYWRELNEDTGRM